MSLRPALVLIAIAVLTASRTIVASMEAFTAQSPPLGCGGGRVVDYRGFGAPQRVVIDGYTGDAMEPFISKDGNKLFFNNSNDPKIDTDLFFAVRTGPMRFRFAGPVVATNSAALDAVPSVDASGQLYFISTRAYASTLETIFTTGPQGADKALAIPVKGLSQHTPGQLNFDAEISSDGHTLWLVDGTFDGGPMPKRATIAIATGNGSQFVRNPDSDVRLQAINAAGLNYAPAISSDGRELFFTRMTNMGWSTTPVICRSVEQRDGRFGAPQLVAAATGFVEAPSLSQDGHALYFHRRDGDRYAIYRINR